MQSIKDRYFPDCTKMHCCVYLIGKVIVFTLVNNSFVKFNHILPTSIHFIFLWTKILYLKPRSKGGRGKFRNCKCISSICLSLRKLFVKCFFNQQEICFKCKAFFQTFVHISLLDSCASIPMYRIACLLAKIYLKMVSVHGVSHRR